MRVHISLDFETRSLVDLPEEGLYKYARHSSTVPLCLCWSIEGQQMNGHDYVHAWIIHKANPVGLLSLLEIADVCFHAWNAQFEYEIWKECCCKKLGWPEPPPLSQWSDTMAKAAIVGYPQDLDSTSALVGTQKKSQNGKRLIKELCIPNKEGKLPNLQDPITKSRIRELVEYCKQDVRAEISADKYFGDIQSDYEHRVWEHVCLMNRRGLPVDVASLDIVIEKLELDATRSQALIGILSDGGVTAGTQTQRIRTYCSRFGVDLPDLSAATVSKVLDNEDAYHPNVVKILRLRQSAGKTSTAKFQKIKNMVCDDGTVKGNLRYHGAGPGRHAGMGMQPQNLPRFTLKNPDEVLEMFRRCELATLVLFYDIGKVASGLIRHMIKAFNGFKLLASDFSSIEARGACWLCGEQELIDAFNKGFDIYIMAAAGIFNKRYEDIDKHGEERQAGKVAILACGYAGGYIVYMRMAETYRFHVTEDQAKKIVSDFRRSRPKLVAAWKQFENAAIMACRKENHGTRFFVVEVENISFCQKGEWLTMRLPSGRDVYYPASRIENKEDRFGYLKEVVVSKWKDSTTHQWVDRDMSGPLFFQNCIQGLCRDLLVDAQLRLEDKDYPQIGSVHDEAISMVPVHSGKTIGEMNRIMNQLPSWAAGFPIGCSGYEAIRYKKD